MHSDLEQQQRDDVMLDFKAGRIDALIATDIVARGIDIEDIAMVVNYDVPRCAEDYVHRIGRTARANAGGIAVTLVAGGNEQMKFGQIERFLGNEILKNPLPEEMGPSPAYNPGGKGKPFRKNRGNATGNRRNPSAAGKPGAAARPSDKSGKPRKNNRSNRPKDQSKDQSVQ